MFGSFNVCIPTTAQSTHLILRVAKPQKLAEKSYPGTVDEKISCEVATYAWMQEHCPDIRIPRLYAFGFADGRHFTHESQMPLWTRVMRYIRRTVHRILGRPLLSRYVAHPSPSRLSTGYMLLENVRSETSRPLSDTWYATTDPGDARRRNLYTGMARVMLAHARIPQPRIGCFCFHDDGTVTLTNRPFSNGMATLENDGTPRVIPRARTYSSAQSFASDMLAFHDARMRTYPNAVIDEEHCLEQIALRVLLRDRVPDYTPADDPLVMQLADVHPGNIFVDDEWNVTCLVDLEWALVLPAGMLELAEFDSRRELFVAVLAGEERRLPDPPALDVAGALQNNWTSGRFWFWAAIMSINAMDAMWFDHICPESASWLPARARDLATAWCDNVPAFVQEKVAQYRDYERQVMETFYPHEMSSPAGVTK